MSVISKWEKLCQDCFWEHTITDDDDYWHHVDYIHFNPVNHGYVKSPKDWPWPSFGKIVKKETYTKDSAAGDDIVIDDIECD
jgi:putative transposase